jgi:guanylate kinase
LIISGPSGSGKTTIATKLLTTVDGAVKLLTTTTRARRKGERDGIDYRFMSRDEFDIRLHRKEFLEHAEVYGNMYGSLRADLEGLRDRNRVVIAVVDVQGAQYIKSVCPDAVTVFLSTDRKTLRDRLELRGDTKPEDVAQRLAVADSEAAVASSFNCIINNDDGKLDDALHAINLIIDVYAPD